MKIKTIFLTFSLALICCTSPKGPAYNIDFIVYNWSRFNDTTRQQIPIFFKCRIYANINESGLAKIYYYQGYPEPESYYFSTNFDKSFLDHIINASRQIDSLKLHVFDSIPLIYDGPIFKIRIRTIGQEDKFFDFINLTYSNDIDTLRTLYDKIESYFSKNKYIIFINKHKKINDSLTFENQRNDFINYVIRYDTIHNPMIMRTPPYID